MVRLLSILLACITLAPAQTSDIYRIGGQVSAPVVLKQQQPEYSAAARALGVEGTALLRVVIDANGRVSEAKILRPAGFGLDDEASKAVSQWEFKPARKDDQPVRVQAQVEINFRLLDAATQTKWFLTNYTYEGPPGADWPEFLTGDRPSFPDNLPMEASVRVKAEIDEAGLVREVKQISSSQMTLTGEIMRTLMGWRFEPAKQAGLPVRSAVYMTFVRR